MANNNVSNSEQFSPEELIKRLKSQLNINSSIKDDDVEESAVVSSTEAQENETSYTTGDDLEPDTLPGSNDSAETDIETNENDISFDATENDVLNGDAGTVFLHDPQNAPEGSEPLKKEDEPDVASTPTDVDVDFLAFLSQVSGKDVEDVADDRNNDAESIYDFLNASNTNDTLNDSCENLIDNTSEVLSRSFDSSEDDSPVEEIGNVDVKDIDTEVENDSCDVEDSNSFANDTVEYSSVDNRLVENDDVRIDDDNTSNYDEQPVISGDLVSQKDLFDSEETDYDLEENAGAVSDDSDTHKPTPDFNMLIALGIPVSEVEKIYGADAAAEYTKLTNGDDSVPVQDSDSDQYEYSSRSQNTEINEYYRKEKVISFTKVCFAGVLLVLAFLFENLPAFGVEFNGWLSQIKYPVVHVMIDLQLVFIAASLALDEIIAGVKSIFAKAPNSGSVLFVAFVVNLIADILLCFSGEAIGSARLSGAAFILMVFACVASSFVKLSVESKNFDLVSNKGIKCCAFTSSPDDDKERIAFFDKAADEEADAAKIISFGKTGFVSGFFRRHNDENVTLIDKVLIPVALVAVVASVVISYATHNTVISIYGAISASASFVFPVCIFTAGVLTYAKACKFAESMKSAIIGQVSPFEYSSASVVSFDDKDAYPSYCVKLRNLKVYGRIAILDVLRITSAVFRIVGGPLNDVLENATTELDKNVPATITRYCDSGIEAEYDGKRILIGKADFLHSYGIIPYSDVDDREYLKSGDVSIMYIAVDDELSAKFYVQYTLDVDFEVLLKDLNRAGICVSIRTSDPNIDNRLLQSKLNLNKTALKIVYREPVSERSAAVVEADSGVVGTGTPSELVHTVMLCDRTAQVLKTNNIIKAASLLVGVILLMVLTLITNGINLISAVFLLYQIFWMLPTLIVSRLFL